MLDGKGPERIVMHKLCFRCVADAPRALAPGVDAFCGVVRASFACVRRSCKTCNTALKMGNFSALDGVFYCMPHFKQLSTASGSNLDEMAGKESRTRGAAAMSAPACAFCAPRACTRPLRQPR